jgi:hypothetical protein
MLGKMALVFGVVALLGCGEVPGDAGVSASCFPKKAATPRMK